MLRVIVILVCGAVSSGLVAWLGNKLGRQVGRRKMSIFGLRPRHTSNVITVATGSLIFLVTLGVAYVGSEEVRTFLAGYQELKSQREDLQREVDTLSQKIKELAVKQSLGPIFSSGQSLAAGVIECGKPAAQVRQRIDTLLKLANENAVSRNNLKALEARSRQLDLTPLDVDAQLIRYDPDKLGEFVDDLSRAPLGTSYACQIWAGFQPWYFGDPIQVEFWYRPNRRVFTRGQVIVKSVIDGREPSDRVLNSLRTLIDKELGWAAMAQDMIRLPGTNKVELPLDPQAVRRFADKIAEGNKAVEVKVVANRDIFPLGPLDVRLVVSPP